MENRSQRNLQIFYIKLNIKQYKYSARSVFFPYAYVYAYVYNRMRSCPYMRVCVCVCFAYARDLQVNLGHK